MLEGGERGGGISLTCTAVARYGTRALVENTCASASGRRDTRAKAASLKATGM